MHTLMYMLDLLCVYNLDQADLRGRGFQTPGLELIVAAETRLGRTTVSRLFVVSKNG